MARARRRGGACAVALRWVAPVCFAIGFGLVLIELANLADFLNVEVKIDAGPRWEGYKRVVGSSEWADWRLRDVAGLDGSWDEEKYAAGAAFRSHEAGPSATGQRAAPSVRDALTSFEGEEGGENTRDELNEAASEDHAPEADWSEFGAESRLADHQGPDEAQLQFADDAGEDDLQDQVSSGGERGEQYGEDSAVESRGHSEATGLETATERRPVSYGTFDGTIVSLVPQIDLPKRPIVKAYNSDKNYWPWYKILRKHGWQHTTDVPDIRANMLFSKGAVPYLRKGKQMLNSIGVSGCIGGAKVLQLECRRRLAERYGCSYETLAIQPAQFSLDTVEGCKAWHEAATRPENAGKLWLYKPSNTFHGKGIKLFSDVQELFRKVNQCRSTRSVILMEYISRPATMQGGYKFDLRSYLLVGSLDPQLIFFADGFGRKSDTVYSVNDTRTTVHVTNSVQQKRANHFFSFAELGAAMEREMGFDAGYLDRAREYMKKVSVFVFKTTDTQKKPLSRFPGRFHLFAVDWVIDSSGGIHLLEGNGYPLVTEYPVEGLTPAIWEDLIDLVLKVHVKPSELDPRLTVRDGFRHGKWSLIFNELEDDWRVAHDPGAAFNPCTQFPSQVSSTPSTV